MRVRPGKVKMVVRIPRRVPCRRHTLCLAVRQGLGCDTLLLLELHWSFDHGDGQASGDVPFHVAMQDPDARVIGPKPHDGVTTWGNHYGVSFHGHRRER